MVDFATLKKRSQNGSSIKKLSEQLEKMSGKRHAPDDRFWYPQRDASGNAFAVIRFLPPPGEEDQPWVKLFHYGFQDVGGWYIENSPTTLGERDPVYEYNNKLYNGSEEDKKLVKPRKTKFIANILVVQDKANPENEGKVFLYSFGVKIFDKIKGAMFPEFEDEEAMDPTDPWKGANFKLKIRKDGNWPSYDKSEFDSPSVLFEDDDDLIEVLNQTHSLAALVAPDQFKSYDVLKKRFNKVMGFDEPEEQKSNDSNSEYFEESAPEPKAETPKPKKEKKASAPKQEKDSSDDDEEDEDEDDLAFFNNLVNK